MRYLCCLVLLVGLPTQSAFGQTQQDVAPCVTGIVEIDLSAAKQALEAGDPQLCLKELAKLKKEQAFLPPARLMLSRMYLVTSRRREARRNLERAALEHPADPEVYLTFAFLGVMEGRHTDAFVHLEKASALGPRKQWSAQQNKNFEQELVAGRAAVAERRKDWSEAEKWLVKVVEQQPSLANLDRLARCYQRLGNLDAALEQLKRAKSIEAKRLPPAISLAALFTEQGKLDESRRILEAAFQESPREGRLARELGAIAMMQGDDERAFELIKRAGGLGDDSRTQTLLLAMIARRQKQYADAIKALDRLRRESPADLQAANQLALVLIESSNEDMRRKALRVAEQNVNLYPNRGDVLATLGWLYFREGRLPDAERLLRAAAKQEPIRTQTAYFLARFFAKHGNDADAKSAKALLGKLMKGPGIFVLRPDAEAWLADNEGPKDAEEK